MVYGDTWRALCVAYVETGDDTVIRQKVKEYLEEEKRDLEIARIRRAQQDAAVAVYRQLLEGRKATNLKTSDVATVRPTWVKPRDFYGRPKDEDAESAAWYEGHVQTAKGSRGRLWLLKEHACQQGYCGLTAKWEHPDGSHWCEKHSKEHLAQEASQSVTPEFIPQWAAIGIPNGLYTRSETIIKLAK